MSPALSNKALLFLVDGDLEQLFLKMVCRGASVLCTNCNGKAVKIAVMAKKMASLIRLRGKSARRVIVLFDRERRTESAEELCDQLATALQAEGIDTSSVIIGCADRMIESWIAAERTALERKLGLQAKYTYDEGTCDKGTIKKEFRRKKEVYIEVVDGVELLRASDPTVMASRSASARAFFSKIDFDCGWLSKGQAALA